MAIFPCDNVEPCADPSIPLSNYSSEAPDPLTFFGVEYPTVPPGDPTDGGNTFRASGCSSQCTSIVSQEDADLCAARQAAICANPQALLFFNNATGCTILCADGSAFTVTVNSGTFVARTQAGADEQAAAYACFSASLHLICLGSPSVSAFCIETETTVTIPVSGFGVNAFSSVFVVSGQLPPGMAINQILQNGLAVISGTPNLAGNWTFRLRVNSGNYHMEKTFTLCVNAIAPESFTFTQNQLANGPLALSPCGIKVKTWAVISGSLPTGVTLDPDTGILSGTPTTAGSYSAVISAQT